MYEKYLHDLFEFILQFFLFKWQSNQIISQLELFQYNIINK